MDEKSPQELAFISAHSKACDAFLLSSNEDAPDYMEKIAEVLHHWSAWLTDHGKAAESDAKRITAELWSWRAMQWRKAVKQEVSNVQG